MFASLNHTLNQPVPEPGSEDEGRTQPHEVVGRLAYLIDQLSQDQQLKLLRALFKDKLGNVLLKLFVDIPASQRLSLMHQLESIILKSGSPNKRKYPRKTCLINAAVSAKGYLDGFIWRWVKIRHQDICIFLRASAIMALEKPRE